MVELAPVNSTVAILSRTIFHAFVHGTPCLRILWGVYGIFWRRPNHFSHAIWFVVLEHERTLVNSPVVPMQLSQAFSFSVLDEGSNANRGFGIVFGCSSEFFVQRVSDPGSSSSSSEDKKEGAATEPTCFANDSIWE